MNGEHERWYPAGPAETFEALRLVIYGTHGIKSKDDFAMSIGFEASGGGLSSGLNCNAHVQPRDGGSVVTLGGAGKVRTQIANQSAMNRIAETLFAGISAKIQEQRAKA